MNYKRIKNLICLLVVMGFAVLSQPAFSQIPTPFFETWDSTAIDTISWTEITGTTEIIDAGGVATGTFPYAVPSEPYFLAMNGTNGTLASGEFDLSAASNFVLVVSESEHDLEPGESVQIEYFTDLAVWDTLVVFPGTDNGFGTFEPFEVQVFNLPADAYHAGFRFRFVTVGGLSTTDEWFFDNIFLGQAVDYPSVDVGVTSLHETTGYTHLATSQTTLINAV